MKKLLKIHVLEQAKLVWIRFIQRTLFANDIQSRQEHHDISKCSKLKRLAPKWFPDENLLRLSGKLDKSLL